MPVNRLLRAAFAALAVTALASARPAAAQTVMKLANATINDVQHEWQKLFAADLQKRIGDKVKTEIYPASQLGAIPRMVDGVLLGTIESFITPTAFLTPTDPRFQIFDVPGLFVSPEHVHAVIHDPAYRDHMETMFLNRGLRIIGAIYNSPTVVLTKQPAPTLEALKGMKVRTFASPLQIEPMKAIGAIPVPLALTEVIPQLQSGGLDGMLAGMPILTAFKYYDVAKFVTDLNFAQIISVDVINEALVPETAQGRSRGHSRRRPSRRAAGIPLGRRQRAEDQRAMAYQQRRNSQAAPTGAGLDDADLRFSRNQYRCAKSRGEGRDGEASGACRRQTAEVTSS
jgi:TRAP-type C4-dicarboxylate transport system substrate-binding protein